MGSIGWHNPYPFEPGGGETEVELQYNALRGSVGDGGSAEDDNGTVDGVWRQARASGMAQVSGTGQRAALQALPYLATDALEYYESLLFITPDPNETDEERRQAATTRYIERIQATAPDIEADLKAIDPRFSLVSIASGQTETTQHGRAFQDLAGTLPFNGGRQSTIFPNYSTEFVEYVLFALSVGTPPTIAEQLLIEQAKRHLDDVLPSWVNFQVFTKLGFILDQDLLDLTGLNP